MSPNEMVPLQIDLAIDGGRYRFVRHATLATQFRR